jgi:hypothetical protein
MMGPASSIRYDDPSDKDYGYYHESNNGFEDRAIHIIGASYFQKVKQLHMDIVKFNKEYIETTTDIDHLNQEGMRLRHKLETIYKEYNNGKPIWIFPCNEKQWIKPTTLPIPLYTLPNGKKLKKPTKKQVWGINTDFKENVIYDMELGQWIDMNDNSDDGPSVEMWKIKMEWPEKAMAQEDDTRIQMFEMNLDFLTPNLMVPDLRILSFFGSGPQGQVVDDTYKYVHDGGELRRKRHHIPDQTTYISDLRDQCTLATTTESVIKVVDFNHPKTDSCGYYLNTGTPSILAVPYWALCKLVS